SVVLSRVRIFRMSASSNTTPHRDSAESSDTSREKPSRRSFVFFGALAATSLVPRALHAQGRSKVRRPAEPTDRPAAPDRPSESVAAFAEWQSSLGRLVRRTTLGVSAAEMARAQQLGYDGYL